MAAKLTRLTHKVAIQLHLLTEGCTIYSTRSRRPVRKLLDTPSYIFLSKRKESEGSCTYYPSNSERENCLKHQFCEIT
jgi:hypothetical protein